MRVRFLTVQEVMDVHDLVLEEHGGALGLRDPSMLDSAVHTPQASFGGRYLYPGVFDMGAAYIIHITSNHPFVDGNKRTAWISTRLFLRLNGYQLKPRKREAVAIMLAVAEGRTRSWHDVSAWLAAHAKAAI